jgi:hypothetical protein
MADQAGGVTFAVTLVTAGLDAVRQREVEINFRRIIRVTYRPQGRRTLSGFSCYENLTCVSSMNVIPL